MMAKAAPAAPAGATAAPHSAVRINDDGMNCYLHDRSAAIGVCAVCLRAMCRDCVGIDTPRLVCRSCAGQRSVLGFEYRSAIVIGGWPVQFLPPTGPLAEEALAEAVETDVEGTSARVFTAEHLAALALQTGRAKDKARLLQFIESGALDVSRFQSILTRHALGAAWQKFERQFLSDSP